MGAASKSAWCRGQGVYPAELDKWRLRRTAALAEPEEARATSQATRQDRKRIKELERDLLRKDRALAETAALLGINTNFPRNQLQRRALRRQQSRYRSVLECLPYRANSILHPRPQLVFCRGDNYSDAGGGAPCGRHNGGVLSG